MISPLVVIASVQAAVRFYRVGDRALAQKLRDRAMWVPGARFPYRQEEKSPAALRDLVEGQDLGFREWLEADPSRIGIYRAMLAGDQGAVARMRLLWTIFKRSVLDLEQDETRSHEEVLADIEYKEISNWLESEDAPVPPWAAFAIALADIAAGFVAANPQIAVEGSNGRALVGAFASSIGSLIPDDGNFGRREAVGSRLMGVVLRAGLETMAANRDIVFETAEVKALVEATVIPVIAAFPGGLAEQLEWERVADALMEPAASAAFRIIAENPSAFFGERFDTGRLVGTMTQDLLREASATGLDGIVGRQGLIGLYTTALGVVARRPELVLIEDGPRSDFFRGLLGDLAATLAQKPFDLDGRVLARLAQAALDGVGSEADRLLALDPSQPWEKVAALALQQTLAGLSRGIGERKRLEALFGPEQVAELVRLAAAQAAKTPGMIAGDSTELQGVVAVVAAALARAEGPPLDGRALLEVIAAALDHAAANPGRLFGLSPGSPEDEIGARVIAAVLSEAASVARADRGAGGVLFGDTLRDALLMALAAAAENPRAVAEALLPDADGRAKLSVLMGRISELVALRDGDGRFGTGAAGWLRLFGALLPELLQDGRVPLLVEAGRPTELAIALSGDNIRAAIRGAAVQGAVIQGTVVQGVGA